MGITDNRGSIALEASMTVPLFIFFIATLLMGIEAVRLQSNVNEALCEAVSYELTTLKEGNGSGIVSGYLDGLENAYLCVRGEKDGIKVSERSFGDGIINLGAEYGIRPFISIMPIGSINISDNVYAHTFSGYTGGEWGSGKRTEDEYVYITETGKKYHLSADCSYINITPSAVDISYVESARNKYGAKYYPCERCGGAVSGTVFITTDGNRYHSSAVCSGLKRTVYVVLLSEALGNGYTPCSKCG